MFWLVELKRLCENMFEIKGKVALVTGGASGIGLQYATELLKSGLKGITLADINEELAEKALEELNQKFGNGKAIFVKVDVTDKEQFEDAFKKTIEVFGNIDILINNAGIFNETENEWEKMIDINIKGTVYGTILAIQNYIKKHKSGKEGVIVNISSTAGANPLSATPIYSATKHAVIGLTRSFGDQMHYYLSKVRVFSICPGFTDTPLMKNFETRILSPDYLMVYEQIKDLMIYQEPIEVARHAIELIQTASQGSIWIVENNEPPYEFSYTTTKGFQDIQLKYYKQLKSPSN